MIILGPNKDKAIAILSKMQKNGEETNYDKLKEHNECEHTESKPSEDVKMCVSKLISAMQTGNTDAVLENLTKIVKMVK